ncbi:MAG: LCP family protein [Chloroflexota bacterium]
MRKIFYIFLLIIFVSLACNFPGYGNSNQSTPQAVAQRVVTLDPNAAPTPTPFMPVPITPTPSLPTPVAEITPTPGELATPEPVEVPADVVTFLMLGSDWRPNAGFRTDIIILVIINTRTGAVSLVSFPRDLYVEIPGIGQQRINTAQQFGGFSLNQSTFQINFGIRPDYYVMTNFQGFVNIIDRIGGVEVETANNLRDTCKLPQAVNGYCSVGPGRVYMNGQTALWYVRSRYSSSDFDRTRRAQEVTLAVFKKLMSLDAIAKAPQLYQEFRNNVETDIPLDLAIRLATFAPGLVSNPEKIQRFAIGPGDVWNFTTDTSAQVLIPNPDRIQAILIQALNVE